MVGEDNCRQSRDFSKNLKAVTSEAFYQSVGFSQGNWSILFFFLICYQCLFFQVIEDTQISHPYPLSFMSNSTKAGEEESRCGLNVRGAVMDTRVMIWWTGTADPKDGSRRLKVLFSFFTDDPLTSVHCSGLESTKQIQNIKNNVF